MRTSLERGLQHTRQPDQVTGEGGLGQCDHYLSDMKKDTKTDVDSEPTPFEIKCEWNRFNSAHTNRRLILLGADLSCRAWLKTARPREIPKAK